MYIISSVNWWYLPGQIFEFLTTSQCLLNFSLMWVAIRGPLSLSHHLTLSTRGQIICVSHWQVFRSCGDSYVQIKHLADKIQTLSLGSIFNGMRLKDLGEERKIGYVWEGPRWLGSRSQDKASLQRCSLVNQNVWGLCPQVFICYTDQEIT